jgi:hypothetical protein
MKETTRLAQFESHNRLEAEGFGSIARWRGKITSAGNVSEATKRMVAQLSNRELAAYLASQTAHALRPE